MLQDIETWKKRNPIVSNPAEEYFMHLIPLKKSALNRLILLDALPALKIAIIAFQNDLDAFVHIYKVLIEPEDKSSD